jgi:hypothetical protein
MKRIIQRKENEVTGICRTLHNEKLHSSESSPDSDQTNENEDGFTC